MAVTGKKKSDGKKAKTNAKLKLRVTAKSKLKLKVTPKSKLVLKPKPKPKAIVKPRGGLRLKVRRLVAGTRVRRPASLNGAAKNGHKPDAVEELAIDLEESPKVLKALEIGRAKGYITQDELLALFPDVEDEVNELDEAQTALAGEGIEIVEQAEDSEEGADDDDPPSDDEEDVRRKLRKSKKKPVAGVDQGILGVDVEDTIGLYLKEVGRVPLLTAEEEVWLAKRIEKAVKSSEELETQRRMGPTRRAEILHDIADGLAAREHLVTANSRLVISVAKKYIGRGVPFLDLIQEGNIGVLRAAKKFDHHRGHKFSTYATWWIRQAVTRAIADQGRTIRVPVHMGDQINKLLRASHSLTQQLGRDPSTDELAVALEVGPRKVEDMQQIARRPLSLEMSTDDEDDSSLGDFITDVESPEPAGVTEQKMRREHIDEELAKMPAREVQILKLRYGLHDGEAYTLEEVGKMMGVTRERVRQIEAQALSRLRHPEQRQKLREYLKEDSA